MGDLIKSNIEKVNYLIKNALEKSKYKQDVKLIAVSKTVDVDKVKEAIDSGVVDFGENKPQELVRKYEVYNDLKWHLIGTLQKNKVKHIIDKACMIHSLDSFALCDEVDKRAKDKNIIIPCLIQINISGEETKHGINEGELTEFVKVVTERNTNIKLKGLMGMAAYEENKEKTRPYFQRMKELLVSINSKNINNLEMTELSMGMSNDFEVAIEEGATMVRIGTTIFGERIYIKNN
jgi:pyridoxal phosphate enzyme, yggS family